MTSTSPSMRAIVQRSYGTSDVLELDRVPVPAPGPGEVLVRVRAAGVDRGTWHVMAGLPRVARLGLGLRRPRRLVAGLDASGTVVAVGEGVTRFAVDEEVFGVAQGSFAEYAVAKEGKLARAPDGLAAEHAAVLGISGLTALQALDAARVGAGDSVLVLGGSGGVGHLAVQLAAARGADVTATCSAAKAEHVRRWGAATVLDYRTQEPLDDDVRFDAIVDIAGGTPFGRLRGALRERGTIVFVGEENDSRWTGRLGRPLRAALRMALARQRFVMLVSSENADDLQRLAAHVAAGDATPHVHAVHPLEDAPRAVDELVAGAVVGKLALAVG